MDKQLTVLIIRPQPGADAFAALLGGVETVLSPMMVIEPVSSELGAPEVVILTSSHAVTAVSGVSAIQTCYCVGEATTERALEAGLPAVMAGETAAELAARVIADKPTGSVLYARGRHVAFDMVGALQAAGLKVTEAVVYDQVAGPLTAEALNLLESGNTVVLPLFSARSASLFFEACPAGADLRVVAMSAAVAKTVPKQHAQGLVVVPNPDAEAMARAVRKAALDGKRLEQGQ